MVVNGWNLFYLKLFRLILDQLDVEVTALAEKDPDGFVNHKQTRFLKAVLDNVRINVPNDPGHRDFWLGSTLGENFKDWKRVKRRLPQRYRMFFKYSSSQKQIVYAWINDKNTLRNDGAKTDVYEVFKGMLRRGDIPNDFVSLLKESGPANGNS